MCCNYGIKGINRGKEGPRKLYKTGCCMNAETEVVLYECRNRGGRGETLTVQLYLTTSVKTAICLQGSNGGFKTCYGDW